MVRQGYTTINEVLRDITANNQGMLSNGFNGAFAGGATGVSLRGLTVGATLVLIDGLRMVAVSPGGRRSAQLRRHLQHPVRRDRAHRSPAGRRLRHLRLRRDRRRGQHHPEEDYKGFQFTAEGGAPFKSGGGENIHASITGGWGEAGMNGFVTFEYRKQESISFQSRQGEDWANMNWAPHGGIDLRPGARSAMVANPLFNNAPYLQRPGSSATDPTAFAFLNSNCDFARRQANQCIFDNTWDNVTPETENINVIGRFNMPLGNDWNLSLTGSWFDSKGEQDRRHLAMPAGSFAPNIAFGPGRPRPSCTASPSS